MRNFPKTPSLTRKTQTTAPKVALHIVCEGKNTEPKYFEDCVAFYGAGLVSLELVRGAGVPITIVETAIARKEQLRKKYKKNPTGFESCYRVWAVFDRDAHPGIPQALQLASANKIDIAFSDPCFELWPLLHIVDYGGQDDRHALQRRLSAEMDGYHHEDGAHINFDLIKDNFHIAQARANNLVQARVNEGAALTRPSTNVDELVLKVIQNGKHWTPKKSTPR